MMKKCVPAVLFLALMAGGLSRGMLFSERMGARRPGGRQPHVTYVMALG